MDNRNVDAEIDVIIAEYVYWDQAVWLGLVLTNKKLSGHCKECFDQN
jgi:hypothetical protein